jgi:hypothetical protein
MLEMAKCAPHPLPGSNASLTTSASKFEHDRHQDDVPK